jgi:hypothetical protein
MSVAERILHERLAAEIRQLIVGRSVEEAITLLTSINAGMKADQDEAAVETISVH